MTSKNRRYYWIGLSLICSSGIFYGAACDHHPIDQPDHITATTLPQNLHQSWALLLEDLDLSPAPSSNTAAYQTDPRCSMVYDFSIRWPLREQLATETMGRIELRADPADPGAMILENRATGAYPIHRDIRHPGHEWWNDDIAPITARLTPKGLTPEGSWPGAWLAPQRPLGLAAFFPPLPGASAADWEFTTGSGDFERTLHLQTREVGRFAVDGETIRVIDAAGRPGQGFSGRYLFSERGRLLAALWTAPSSHDEPAIAAIRLTGTCEGVVMAPLPREQNTAQDVIETWTRFARGLQSDEPTRVLHTLAPQLREKYGDEQLLLLLENHLQHHGPRAFGHPLPHSIVEEDDQFSFTALGSASDALTTSIVTEVVARHTEQGIHLLQVRSTTDESRASWDLFDLQ